MHKALLASIVIALAPISARAANVDITFNPSTAILSPGDITFVGMIGTYDGTDKVVGGAISLDFRADLLEVLSVILKVPTDIDGSAGHVSATGNAGRVDTIGFSSFTGVSGTFEIATIEFRALGPLGTSPLTAFDSNDLIFAWANEAFEPVTVSSTAGSIAVVPEPASWGMMLGGLALTSLIMAWHKRA